MLLNPKQQSSQEAFDKTTHHLWKLVSLLKKNADQNSYDFMHQIVGALLNINTVHTHPRDVPGQGLGVLLSSVVRRLGFAAGIQARRHQTRLFNLLHMSLSYHPDLLSPHHCFRLSSHSFTIWLMMRFEMFMLESDYVEGNSTIISMDGYGITMVRLKMRRKWRRAGSEKLV